MKINKIILAYFFCSVLTSYAQEDVNYSVGLRLWNDTWQGNSFYNLNGKMVNAVQASNPNSVAIPLVSVKYKDYGISFSRSLPNQFSLSDGINSNQTTRSETDLNFLYYFLPNLSTSIGYKTIEWSGLQNKGPILAISASAPLATSLGLYGSAGLGLWTSTIPTLGKLNSNYNVGEFGLSYTFIDPIKNIKASTITLGYRFQKLTAKNAPFANYRDVSDTTSGVVLGYINSF